MVKSFLKKSPLNIYCAYLRVLFHFFLYKLFSIGEYTKLKNDERKRIVVCEQTEVAAKQQIERADCVCFSAIGVQNRISSFQWWRTKERPERMNKRHNRKT